MMETVQPTVRGCLDRPQPQEAEMNNIFYIIGVVVVVLIILGYFGLR
jgi:hypothetical protein